MATAIDITIQAFRTTLISSYGPNKDDPDFYANLSNIKHGKGTWKFNNSLLTDDKYIAKIRKSINYVKLLYAATPYNHENISIYPPR